MEVNKIRYFIPPNWLSLLFLIMFEYILIQIAKTKDDYSVFFLGQKKQKIHNMVFLVKRFPTLLQI